MAACAVEENRGLEVDAAASQWGANDMTAPGAGAGHGESENLRERAKLQLLPAISKSAAPQEKFCGDRRQAADLARAAGAPTADSMAITGRERAEQARGSERTLFGAQLELLAFLWRR